jgi:hypothetical protein
VTGRFRPGDVRHIMADPSAAASGLGFHTETDFHTGIAELARAPLRQPAPGTTSRPPSATKIRPAGPDCRPLPHRKRPPTPHR